ncbi:hypothetical protein C9374_009748 [Naegleria lovaniensis]|uniref:Uncharacterized protein n=1 Tax=Naegleria lovaniensis TaxID=51637 RepID=A0AA88KRB5_NAELO|nr:uncharacterized protein C9374_009748 [Naegleria lovaniensis]KAG2393171.1 hypothetical protein C9374_009748 [Naegleria lovaniensis]
MENTPPKASHFAAHKATLSPPTRMNSTKDSPVKNILLIPPQRKRLMEETIRKMSPDDREKLVQAIYAKSAKLSTEYHINIFNQKTSHIKQEE